MSFEKNWKKAKAAYDSQVKDHKKELAKTKKRLEKVRKEVAKLEKAGSEDVLDSSDLKKANAERSELIHRLTELDIPERKPTGLQPALKELDRVLHAGLKLIEKGVDKDKKDKWKPFAVILQDSVRNFVVAHAKFENSMGRNHRNNAAASLIKQEERIKRSLDKVLATFGNYLRGKNW